MMLFSVVDDRSGVVYQEYALIYGEDAEAAQRFLFRAMAPKEDNPFEGIPENIQLDDGPVSNPSPSTPLLTTFHTLCLIFISRMAGLGGELTIVFW
ncbi:hypothetical protein U1737_06790 [Sphingomonas sp. LB3N6]|uniref:hypothetical protein n=1 Tax=Sphingomonas fucosidasi TaxID=3096164 RepID=UPI002FCCB85D